MKESKPNASDNGYAFSRRGMLDQLRRYGLHDERVLAAMAKVPRHRFVPESEQDSAYRDNPVVIGHGQTVSQPYMVGLMTQCLELKGDERILEIGTGSGYQTAILAELAAEVYSIERIEGLLLEAQNRLSRLGYKNIHSRAADGTKGWPEAAPFDGIIVTAAAPRVASSWEAQLAEGGRIVVPVGPRFGQTLKVYRKEAGELTENSVCACVFVPLLGEEGWTEEGFWD